MISILQKVLEMSIMWQYDCQISNRFDQNQLRQRRLSTGSQKLKYEINQFAYYRYYAYVHCIITARYCIENKCVLLATYRCYHSQI